MRLRICVLLSIVALCATTLTVATAGPVTTHGATEATASTTPPHTAGRTDSLSRVRSDARIGFRPEIGPLFTEFEGPVTFSPDPRQGRTYRAVLLDGGDRWRSLLHGAPPLFS
jgi:hypothetical protein